MGFASVLDESGLWNVKLMNCAVDLCTDAVKFLHMAVEIYTDMGRLNQAARYIRVGFCTMALYFQLILRNQWCCNIMSTGFPGNILW